MFVRLLKNTCYNFRIILACQSGVRPSRLTTPRKISDKNIVFSTFGCRKYHLEQPEWKKRHSFAVKKFPRGGGELIRLEGSFSLVQQESAKKSEFGKS